MTKYAKHIPNALGFMRALLCVILVPLIVFGTREFTLTIFILYVVAGVSDMIDGPISRRVKGAQSQFGATLDSVTDMLLVFVGILLMMPLLMVTLWGWLFPAYLVALSFKVMSGVIGQIKHKQMVFLHTYTNKLLGFLLFIIPIIYFFSVVVPGAEAAHAALNIYIIFVMVVIYIITAEEIIINLRLIEPCRDIKSVFGVPAANAAIIARRAKNAEQKMEEHSEKNEIIDEIMSDEIIEQQTT